MAAEVAMDVDNGEVLVMDSLPMATDTDGTLAMDLSGEMPAAVAVMLQKEAKAAKEFVEDKDEEKVKVLCSKPTALLNRSGFLGGPVEHKNRQSPMCLGICC